MYIICGSYYLTINQTDQNSVLPLLNSGALEKDLEEIGSSNSYCASPVKTSLNDELDKKSARVLEICLLHGCVVVSFPIGTNKIDVWRKGKIIRFGSFGKLCHLRHLT